MLLPRLDKAHCNNMPRDNRFRALLLVERMERYRMLFRA